MTPAISERSGGFVSVIDVQEAFRRGIRGVDYVPGVAPLALAEAAPTFAAGPNEEALLQLSRLAGLRDPRAAYETGRALRMIVRLFDQARAPQRIGRQFIDNLAGAVVVEHMRGRSRPWGAADTVDMFVELYARILGDQPVEIDRLRRVVMDYAVSDTEERRSADKTGLGALFRRRRAINGASS